MATNNAVNFGDVQVVVKSVSSQGNRLSPDYFMCTQIGRVLVAKVQDREGSFIEWIQEVGNTASAYTPGVYYISVDSIDDSTRIMGMTVGSFLWKQGQVTNAEGSQIIIRSDISTTGLVLTDTSVSPNPLQFQTYPNSLMLLSPANTLTITTSAGVVLQPNVHYWYQRTQSIVLTSATAGGEQQLVVPVGYADFSLTDQDGYELQFGVDYTLGPNGNVILLPSWTPAGSSLTISGIVQLDPTTNSPVNPENFVAIDLQAGQSVATEQVIIYASSGDYNTITQLTTGYTFPVLLTPGQGATWEVRVNCGQFKTFISKMSLNSIYQWVPQPAGNTSVPVITEVLDGETVNWVLKADSNGNLTNLIPGVKIAIGDQLTVNDQAAVIVNPSVCQTYELYGSKENVSFTLEVKANDSLTASEISELLKRELLMTRRTEMESDGVSIQEIARSSQGEQKDMSGRTSRYTYSLGVSALCDWKVYVPLVTRITNFDVTMTGYTNTDFVGKLSVPPRALLFGENRFLATYDFIPSYS